MKNQLLFVLSSLSAALLFVTLPSCSDSASTPEGTGGSGNGGAGGDGGETATPPDYAAAFPQDRVPRLDIKLSAAQFQAMVDDMTDMLGAFGTGSIGGGMGGGPPGGGMGGGPPGPGGGMPPQEAIDACNGLAVGDACSFSFMGFNISAMCSDDANGGLICNPMGGGMLPGGMGGGFDLLPRTPIYADCEVSTADQKWEHVGVRFKGNSSLAMPWMQGVWKLPFRLKFDKYEDTYPETLNQRFYGFQSLGLSNGSMDSSLLRDKLGTDVFASAGIAVPATAFYRVFVDHGDGPTYFGLYTGIEIPSDESFMDTHFGGHKGNLYKPDGTGAQWATYDEATLGKENHEDVADFSDVKALFDALHADRSDAAAYRAGLEARFDVDGFLHWLALNTVIQDWDTYGKMPHNYYIYADPKHDGRITWIPWDHSFAFSAQSNPFSLSLAEATDQWPLIRFLMDDPVYHEVYRGYVEQAAKTQYEPVSAEKRFKAAHDLIAPYVVGAEGEQPGYTLLQSPAAFEASLAELVAHAKARQTAVATFLGP